jgi:aspartate kinase
LKTLVQKFGGTSVQTSAVRRKAAQHVADAVLKGHRVVAVVSAMGRKGDPYATDELLSMVENREVVHRDVDILLSCGEAISAVVFAAELREQGLQTTVLSGSQAGILTDDRHGNARILSVCTDRLVRELRDNHVVVVMGYQGKTESGDVTTLGRGGSDTTATAIGTALGADRVDIFSDVDGIFTADPRVVTGATLLLHLSYTDACTMATEGAKVIHPRAVEVAMRTNIPVMVRHTGKDALGTHIGTVQGQVEDHKRFGGCIIGIAHETSRVQVTVRTSADEQQAVFAAVERAGVQPEFCLSSPTQLSFTIPAMDAKEVARSLDEIGQGHELVKDCARVSVIGRRLDEIPGLMGRVLETLASAGIRVLQSVDSPSVVRVLVQAIDMERTVQALHRRFVENRVDDLPTFVVATLAGTAAAGCD